MVISKEVLGNKVDKSKQFTFEISLIFMEYLPYPHQENLCSMREAYYPDMKM